MKLHYFPTPRAANTLSTAELRETFLIGGLFQTGKVVAHYTDLDRMIVGGAVPAATPLELSADKELAADFFLQRREIGIVNLGAPGVVRAGDRRHELGSLDCLYLGRGERDVFFENGSAGQAAFYLVSTPAHAQHPTARVTREQAQSDPIGDPAKANRRRIAKYIHPDGIKSCQLLMGFTEWGSPNSSLAAYGTRCRRTLIAAVRRPISTSTSATTSSSTSWASRKPRGTSSFATARPSCLPPGRSIAAPALPATASSGRWVARTKRSPTWTRCR
jgi:hypothetical protein